MSVRKSIKKEPADAEPTRYEKYNKSLFLFLSALLSIVAYHPFFRFIRLAFFLITVVTFCWAMKTRDQRFNWTFFTFVLLVILMFTSTFATTFFSLSALDNPPEIETPPYSVEVFNYSFTLETINSIFVPLYFFMLVFIPAITLIGAIWAIVKGEINNGVKALIALTILMSILVAFTLLFDSMGLKIPGLTDAVNSFMDFYVSSVTVIYNWIMCFVDPANCKDQAPDIPGQTPSGYENPPAGTQYERNGETVVAGDINGDGVVDTWEEFFYNLNIEGPVLSFDTLRANPYYVQIGISSAIPLLMAAINIMFSLIFISEKARRWTETKFEENVPELEAEEEFHYLHFNYRIAVFYLILATAGWMMFLNFAGIFRNTGIIDFYAFAYMSVYSILIAVSVIFLSLPKVTIYTKANWWNTIMGTILGSAIMFLSFEFVTGSSQTLSAFDYEYSNSAWYQVIITFIYIAPAESLFFHVLFAAMFLGWAHERSEKNAEITSNYYAEHQITLNKAMIKVFENLRDTLPPEEEYIRQKIQYQSLISQYEQELIELQNITVVIDREFVFDDENTGILFYVVLFLINIVFSISHFIPMIASGGDFYIFFLSGLGIIYILGGVIISLVGWRFGWLSAILVHAIFNTRTILMLSIMSGGLA